MAIQTPQENIKCHSEIRSFYDSCQLDGDGYDQYAGFEYLEDSLRAEACFVEELERVLILGLDYVDETSTEANERFDAFDNSVAKDSLEVMKRRAAKEDKAKMKILSDFRRKFTKTAMVTYDLDGSRNTSGPPSA